MSTNHTKCLQESGSIYDILPARNEVVCQDVQRCFDIVSALSLHVHAGRVQRCSALWMSDTPDCRAGAEELEEPLYDDVDMNLDTFFGGVEELQELILAKGRQRPDIMGTPLERFMVLMPVRLPCS